MKRRPSRPQTSLAVSALPMIPVAQAATMNKADYKDAVEKCDTFVDVARNTCLATAKTKFGKN